MKRAFVIGHPIAHSRSPLIHTHWLRTCGIEASYAAVDVSPDDLARFIDEMRAGAYVGGNVTIPHKAAVLTLCDSLDPLAEAIGAVNTLVAGNDAIAGSNTDCAGFLANLDQAAPGWDTGLNEAIVLGAGGAARAILAALKLRGIGTIHLLNRTLANAAALAAEFGGTSGGAFGAAIQPGSLTDFAARAPRAGLVVNTSSVGMNGTSFDIDLALLSKSALVTDIVYVPLETPLLKEARALGLGTIDGLGMLLHQAVPGFAAWFGTTPEVTPALRALIEKTL